MKNSLVIGIVFVFVSIASSQSVIEVDPTETYQTITGWEAGGYAWDEPLHSQSFPLFMDDLADQAVNDLGINRIRLVIRGGAENPTDYGMQYFNGHITEGQYIHNPGYVSQIINDNDDPNVINWSGFHFSFIDHKINNFFDRLGKHDAQGLYDVVISQVEKSLINRAMNWADGNQLKASRVLGINRNTLRSKIRKFDIK